MLSRFKWVLVAIALIGAVSGWFVADAIDHQPGVKPIFNRTIALKDSWVKKSGR